MVLGLKKFLLPENMNAEQIFQSQRNFQIVLDRNGFLLDLERNSSHIELVEQTLIRYYKLKVEKSRNRRLSGKTILDCNNQQKKEKSSEYSVSTVDT